MFSDKQLKKIELNRKDFEKYLKDNLDTSVTVRRTGSIAIYYYDDNSGMDLRYEVNTGNIAYAETRVFVATVEEVPDNHYLKIINHLIENYKDKVERSFNAEFDYYYNFDSVYIIYKSKISDAILIHNKGVVCSFLNDNISINTLTNEDNEDKTQQTVKDMYNVYQLYLDQQSNKDVIYFDNKVFISDKLLKNIVSEKGLKIQKFMNKNLGSDFYKSRKDSIIYSFVLTVVFLLVLAIFLFFFLLMATLSMDFDSNTHEYTIRLTMRILGILFFFISTGIGFYLNKKDFFGIEDIDSLKNSLTRKNVKGYVDITNKPKLLFHIVNKYGFKDHYKEHPDFKIEEESYLSSCDIDLREAIENFDKLDESTQKIVEDNINLIIKNSNNDDFSLNESININMTVLNGILKERGV